MPSLVRVESIEKSLKRPQRTHAQLGQNRIFQQKTAIAVARSQPANSLSRPGAGICETAPKRSSVHDLLQIHANKDVLYLS